MDETPTCTGPPAYLVELALRSGLRIHPEARRHRGEKKC